MIIPLLLEGELVRPYNKVFTEYFVNESLTKFNTKKTK